MKKIFVTEMDSGSIRWWENEERSRAPCLCRTLFPRKRFNRARDEPSMTDISSLGINIVSAIDRLLSLCLLTRESRKMTWRKMDVVHHERRKLRDREFLMKAHRTFIRLTPDKLAVSWKLSIPERANMTSENRIDLL